MEELDLIKYCMQFGFSALVTAFLLWERKGFNLKIIESLKEISATQKQICRELRELRRI